MNSFEKPIFDVVVNVPYYYAEVCKGLYLGHESIAHCLPLLEALGIKKILMIGTGMEPQFPDKFEYMKISIPDTEDQNIYQFFETTYEYIDKALEEKKNIYVHCALGISRSPTLVMAYFIKKFKWSYVDALNFVSKNRKIINPNKSFEKQLIEFYLRINTNILERKRGKKSEKSHINYNHPPKKTRSKFVKIIKSSKEEPVRIKIKHKMPGLKQKQYDLWVVDLCKAIGDELINHLGLSIEKQKEIMLKFVNTPKNFMNQIVIPNSKKCKKKLQRTKDNARRYLKKRGNQLVLDMFKTSFLEDIKIIEWSDNYPNIEPKIVN